MIPNIFNTLLVVMQSCNIHNKALWPEYNNRTTYIIIILFIIFFYSTVFICFAVPTPLVTIDSQILQVYNTSTSLDLTCSTSIDSSESPYVDVFTSAVFKWSYIRGGSEFSEVLPTSKNGLKMYTSSLSLHNINLSSAGEYTCDVYLYSNISFVKNSTNESDKTTIKINGNVTFMCL